MLLKKSRGSLMSLEHAVDGSHIPIKAPMENPNAYYNRKKFHSVVLLATCDANLQFTVYGLLIQGAPTMPQCSDHPSYLPSQQFCFPRGVIYTGIQHFHSWDVYQDLYLYQDERREF